MAKTEYGRDDFQRADGAIGTADVGGAWSSYVTVAPAIVSNELSCALTTGGSGSIKLRSASTLADGITSSLCSTTRAGVSGGVELGPGVRATTTNSGNDAGYNAMAWHNGGSSAHRIVERAASTTTTTATQSAGTLSPGTRRWQAIVCESTAQRAYFWDPGQLPPTSPQVSASDNTITAAGVPCARYTNSSGSTETMVMRRYLATDLAAPGEFSGFAANMSGANIVLSWTKPTDRGACWGKVFRKVGSAAGTGDTLLTGAASDISGVAADGRFGAATWWDWSTFSGPTGLTDSSHGATAGQVVHYLLVAYDVDGEPSAGVAASVEIPAAGSGVSAAMVRRRRRR